MLGMQRIRLWFKNILHTTWSRNVDLTWCWGHCYRSVHIHNILVLIVLDGAIVGVFFCCCCIYLFIFCQFWLNENQNFVTTFCSVSLWMQCLLLISEHQSMLVFSKSSQACWDREVVTRFPHKSFLISRFTYQHFGVWTTMFGWLILWSSPLHCFTSLSCMTYLDYHK